MLVKLVQSQSDRLKLQPCQEVTGLRKLLQDALRTTFGRPFSILYVASKTAEAVSNVSLIQLTQDMFNHSLEHAEEERLCFGSLWPEIVSEN